MRRVDVAVDVDLDGRVHRDDAEAADDLRAVRDFLWAQDHVLLVLLDVLEEARHALRRRREGRARCEAELARIDEVEHAVLDDLRVDREVAEIGVDEARRDGVGDIADARLDWQQVLRHTARLDLTLEELDGQVSHLLRRRIERCERARVVRDVTRHDAADPVGRARDVRRADAVVDMDDRNGQAVRRVERQVDVVHALEFQRLCVVDLDDDDVRRLDERSRVADGRRRDDVALLRDGAGLDDRDVDMAEVAAARELRDLRQMDVDVVDRAVVDLAAQRPVRLERQALLDAVDRGERFVELRSRRGTRHDVDRERVLLHALRERERHRLRVSRGREAARRDRHARLDEFHCLLRRHDLGLQRLVAHTIENINHRKTSLFACSEPRSGHFHKHKNDLSFPI